MRNIFALLLLMPLTACGDEKPLSNDAIIAEVKKCTAADLVPVQFYGWTWRISEIQCQQHVRN